jgi:5-bromo-4-chloroindolyl phosphate hydrolysis protein
MMDKQISSTQYIHEIELLDIDIEYLKNELRISPECKELKKSLGQKLMARRELKLSHEGAIARELQLRPPSVFGRLALLFFSPINNNDEPKN